MPSTKVAIVGGGLAGLCCARRLCSEHVACTVLEAGDAVGGRVRTDVVDGFLLDRGFQVLFDSYPEVRDILDLEALGTEAFKPGALIRLKGKIHRFDDPWRRPTQVLGQLFSPIATASDKLHIARIRRRVGAGTLREIFQREEIPTIEYLRREGFSDSIIEHFFRPFFGGVMLDRTLSSSSRVFEFVFRMLSLGNAILPAKGMQAIPDQIAARLPPGTIRTGCRVASIDGAAVVLNSGERIEADAIVLATDEAATAKLLGQPRHGDWLGVTCLYFAADRSPIEQSIFLLNGDPTGLINSVCVPSQLAPHYAPRGKSLVSVTVLGNPNLSEDALTNEVISRMREWFGDPASSWRHLRTYRIDRAQPVQTPPTRISTGQPEQISEHCFVCGDAFETASINGAMRSGRCAAETVLRRMKSEQATKSLGN